MSTYQVIVTIKKRVNVATCTVNASSEEEAEKIAKQWVAKEYNPYQFYIDASYIEEEDGYGEFPDEIDWDGEV